MGSEVPNRGPELRAVNIAFLITAVIAYSLRCYVRVGMVKGYKYDDWLMGFALLFFIAYCTSSNIGVHYGTGRHYTDLSIENFSRARHAWYFCYLFYCSSMICSKISIGCFLLRIAIRKVHTWFIYGVMTVSLVSGLTFFFVTLFQCHPVSYFWNTRQDGGCININIVIVLAYVYSAFSIITDFTFALLPTFLIVHLQLKRKTKIALIPLLTMGCIASSAVVVRLPFLLEIGSPDFLWATSDIAIWSTIEQGLAITAGSLATIRPLFSIILYKLGLSSYTTKQQTPVFGGHPSGGHPSVSNRIVGGKREASSRDKYDMYKLSSGGDEESGPVNLQVPQDSSPKPSPTSPNWYQTHFDRVKRGSYGKGKKNMDITALASDDGSEKSLRETSDTHSLSEERGMQIMVSRSFVVSDAERTSYVEKENV
ncbi:hypothetical protein CC80DRAFT_441815 [Byssothecium circinans]|uniref:Rhodopsin domain-containing protein n=1 Tax=Byssothecium circinans TaxID=147558 RepID=A0A6A5U1E7_9PLEO|nr:hypothetical protein CC80DRAFT_441815 [Byssothecium circinans]